MLIEHIGGARVFDNIVSRKNTNCAKWDEIIDEYGIEDLIPLTVADMDYRVAPEIINAVIEAANHGIYGYTNVSKRYIELSKIWAENNYNFSPQKEWIVYCPRIIQALSLISLSIISEIVALFRLNFLAISALDKVSPAINVDITFLIFSVLAFSLL